MPRFARVLATLLILALQPAFAAAGDDGWVVAAKARSPEDISLWTRTVPGASLKAFRGRMHTDAPVESVVALLHDVNHMCDWIFRCREARYVGSAPTGDSYIYLVIKGIWPLGDRDAVLRVQPSLDPATGALLFRGTAAPDQMPLREDHVRIPAIESTWSVTPTPGGLLRIDWQGHVDPAGNVPLWLANAVATLVPRYTLRSVRDLLDGEYWRRPAEIQVGAALLDQLRRGEKPQPRQR